MANNSSSRSLRVPERQTTPLTAAAQKKPSVHEREMPHGLRTVSKSRRWWPWFVFGGLIVILLGIFASYMWYQRALLPVDEQSEEEILLVVEEGESVAVIADELESQGIINSAFAMQIYTELSGTKTGLQIGRYLVSPSQSTPEIVSMLVDGRTSEVPWTIIPGDTLQDVKASLQELGYTEQEVDTALEATYDHPLLADKPDDASLEGYLYPETYFVAPDEPLEVTFERTMDEFYSVLQEEELIGAFTEQDLTIHEALTLGSIIEREVESIEDRRQVSQIFHKRLEENMPLGADSTFVYAAELKGVEPTISIDSPYNTREVEGLPPGPIGAMDLTALEAVANPADGEFLYFVTGDDGTNYFAKTEEEHEENVENYCQELCFIYRE